MLNASLLLIDLGAFVVVLERVSVNGMTLSRVERLPSYVQASVCDAVQLWSPLALTIAKGRWRDISLTQRGFRTVPDSIGAKQLFQSAPALACARCEQPQPFSAASFRDMADRVRQFAKLALRPRHLEYDLDDLKAILEMSVGELESQAALLDNGAQGLGQQGSSHAYAKDFLVRVLLFCRHLRCLKSQSGLRELLTMAVQLVFPNNPGLVKLVENDVKELPSHATLVQASFVLDMAYMMYRRRQHAKFFGIAGASGEEGGNVQGPPAAVYMLADSSPQGGYNWLMVELYIVPAADIALVHKAAYDLIKVARHLNLEAEADEELLSQLALCK